LSIRDTFNGECHVTADTLYVRLGDGLAAIIVLVGVHLLMLSTQGFFVFNVMLVLCWLAGRRCNAGQKASAGIGSRFQ